MIQRAILKPCLVNLISEDNHLVISIHTMGAQRLSGRVLDSRPRDRGFEPHRCHCVVVLEQHTFTLA